jgi:hypothetical protein|nr:MAG TPA: hypothetical protein [Caudoviricetes sp.]
MELTAKDFTAQLAAKGYTPAIDFDVDNGDEPHTVKLTGAITFNGADGFMDFRNAEEFFDITCEAYENLAFFSETYPLTEWQIKEIETDGEPGNAEQEEKFFDAWRVALDGIGIDLNDIKVSSR